MITEAILGIIIDLVVFLVAAIMNFVTAPVSGTFGIPAPLMLAVELSTTGFLAIYPAVLLWFTWRQVWGK
jgi:hypothetical protein